MYKAKQEIWAVVPCKRLEFSNRRLMTVLSVVERQRLACLMLEDVLGGLVNSGYLRGIFIASDDPVVKDIASSFGARCPQSFEDVGLSSALTNASSLLAEEGAHGIVAVHADLPLLTSEDINPVIRGIIENPAITLVPAEKDLGTNVLAMSPPGIIEYAFGKKSSLRHAMAARARRIEPTFIKTSHLSFDIDTPDDLLQFVQSPSDTKTFRYLTESGIRDRLLGSGTNHLQKKAVG